ncbi:MAG: serine protease [Burkholderiales bacterium]
MALIPPFFIDCVVAIGSRNPNGEKRWFGTGFLVGRHHKEVATDQKNYHLFLVTNKHVLKNVESIVVRFNPKTDEPARDYDISLTPRKELVLVGHPNSDIDVVVIYIDASVLEKDQARFAFFALDEHTLRIADVKDHGTSEGDFIYVLGFPMGIVSPDRQYVIVRAGVIARLRDAVDQRSREFLIDANVFPGNSGGPVVLKPEIVSIEGTKTINRAALVGIITSYVQYQDIAISQQTGRPRIIFEENSGLAAVVPSDCIIETVEEAFKQLIERQPVA